MNEPIFQRPYIIEKLRAEIRGEKPPKPPKPEKQRPESGREPGFIYKSAGVWLRDAEKQPEAKMLFGSFWFEGEVCILFADTNVGKSVLAVQIADSISKGRPIGNLQFTAKPSPVLYFDFELTDQQFRKRYSSETGGLYQFHKTVSRAVFNPLADKMNKFGTYQQYLENEIENTILFTKASVVIIDNISCLNFDTSGTAGALNLIRSLQGIKNRRDISILVLAHTPKRNTARPITRNDLQGSKMLINFCDSAFAIGESQAAPGQRYLKQIKQRSSNQQYGAENVCLCNIEKCDNFLQFQFTGHGPETDHLAPYTEQYRKNTETRVAQLHNQNHSIRQIAKQLNIAQTTVFRMVKRMEEREAEEKQVN